MPRHAASSAGSKGPALSVSGAMLGMVSAVPRAGRRVGRRPVAVVLGLLGRRDVEVELDLVGDEHVAAAERLVELHAVLAAAQLAGDLQADLLVAVGVDVGAVDLGGEHDLVRDAVQREVAGDPERLVVDRLAAGRLEAQLGEGVGVEEVGRAQVGVVLGSLVSTEAARTLPRDFAEERSSLISSTPSKSLNSPRTVAIPMCLTAKPTLEWDGSTVHVPAGTAGAEVMEVVMRSSFGSRPMRWTSSCCIHNYSEEIAGATCLCEGGCPRA